jgi:hypothetical protein
VRDREIKSIEKYGGSYAVFFNKGLFGEMDLQRIISGE